MLALLVRLLLPGDAVPVLFLTYSSSDALSAASPIPPVPADLSFRTNQSRFDTLFDAFHSAAPRRVVSPLDCRRVRELDLPARTPRDQLLAYVSVKARARAVGDSTELEFAEDAGGKTEWRAAKAFFQDLAVGADAQRPETLTLIFLEMENQSPSINGTSLGPDCFVLLEDLIRDLDREDLVVVSACASGERSWELIPTDTTKSSSDSAQGADAPASEQKLPVTYAGTVFVDVACQLLAEMDSPPLPDFLLELKTRVKETVQKLHGVEQTVTVLTAGPEPRTILLDRVSRPAWPPATSSQPKPAEEKTADASGKEAEATPESSRQSSGSRPAERITALWTRLNALSASRQVPASHSTVRRMRCESLVILAEQLLLHQQDTDCKRALDEAEKLYKGLEEAPSLPESTVLGGNGAALRLFLRIGAAKDSLTAEKQKECSDFLKASSQSVKKPGESSAAVDPPEMMTTFVLQQLRDIAPENRPDLIQRLRSSLQDAQTLPLPLATIRAALANQKLAEDPEGLPVLLDLLSLRDEMLAATIGLQPGNPSRMLSRSAWLGSVAGTDQKAAIERLFLELAAAESWLVLGDVQWQKAKPIVASVREQWTGIHTHLAQGLADSDSQRTQQQALPYLLQYFASGLERSSKLNELQGLERDKNVSTPDELQSALFELTSRTYPNQVVASRSFKVLQEQLRENLRKDRWAVRQRQLIPPLPGSENRLMHVEDASTVSSSNNLPKSGYGLWTGYWAARYLEQQLTLASPPNSPEAEVVDRIWDKWSRLRQIAIAETDETTTSQLSARAELSEAILEGWKALAESENTATPESTLITIQDAVTLLNRFFEPRATFKWEVASRPNVEGLLRTAQTPISMSKDQLYLADDGKGTLQFSLDPQVGKPRIELLAPMESGLEITDAGSSTETSVGIQRRLSEPLSEPVDTQLLFISSNNVVLSRQPLKVMPSLSSDWKIEIRRAGQELLVANGEQSELPLPPSLSKDPPTDFSVHLIRTKGAVSKVLVQLKRITEDGQLQAVWPAAMEFQVPASQEIQIPLIPPPAAGAPAVTTAPPAADSQQSKGMDFSHGFVISVRSAETAGATSSPAEKVMTVMPRCSSAESFLEIPLATYNSTERKLSLRFRRQPRLPAVAPRLMPVQVHFTPQLLANMAPGLKDDQRQDIQNSDSPMEFEFLQPLQGEATFFVSACGDPYVWGWKLTPNGNCTPLWESGTPVIVTERSDPGVSPKSDLPGLTIFDSQAGGKLLRPRVHILGRAVSQMASIDFFVQQQSPSANTQTRLGESRTIKRFKKHSVFMTPGEEGRWNVTTDTEPWDATESMTLKQGRFRIAAEFRHLGKTITDSFELAVDTTEPEIGEITIQSGSTSGTGTSKTVSPDAPLTGEITGLRDSDTGVALIEVGCKPEELRPLKTFTARAPSDRPWSEKFAVAPEDLTVPEGPGPAKQELIVRVTNHAGISKKSSVTFFVKSVSSAPMEKKEPAPFHVTFILGSAIVGEFKATVDRETKTAKAGDVLQFGPLSAGSHDVKWEDKGKTSGSERIKLDDKGMIEDKPKVYQLPQ